MNLSSSTKLCIVACHSDTPLKKQNIKFNHSILKKTAHTIYINSSRYDKSIPMIHTVKTDKYEKYRQIVSTVNLKNYNVMIWMTDEIKLGFSLVPFIKTAIERGYHSYEDIILLTPRYYLDPYILSEIIVPPIKEDPSFFKSETVISPIQDIAEVVENVVTFPDVSFTPSTSIGAISDAVDYYVHPEKSFILSSSNISGASLDMHSTISSFMLPTNYISLPGRYGSKKYMLMKATVFFTNRLPKIHNVKTKEKELTEVDKLPKVETKEKELPKVETKEKELPEVEIKEKELPEVDKLPKVEIKEKELPWEEQLLTLQTRELPDRVELSTYETVLIAFDPLPYLEFLLRKMILQFPTWSHSVICGNENTEMIEEWNLPIQIISLNIDTITLENYNELLLMESFWTLFKGETLLVYNEDSKPLESNIDALSTQSYVDLKNHTTLRSKKALLYVLQMNPPEEGIDESTYFEEMVNIFYKSDVTEKHNI
jgi:hypothetical protein